MARILVVDDDLSVLETVKLMLQRNDHTVSVAHNGSEGFESATSETVDLIVVDVMMPEMDGYELTERLRADKATKDVRILILTARAQPIDYQSAIEAGADGYLSKPVTGAELNEKVGELLAMERKRAAPEPVVQGYVVTVMGLSGGVGATTVAVNLALGLIKARIRTCLIDLSPAAGHAAMQLRLRPKASWADLDGETGPADVSNLLLRHSSGLTVLAAPMQPVRQGFPGDKFQSTLTALNDLVSVTVVDAAPWLDEATYTSLKQAYIAVLVLTPDPVSIQSFTNTLPVLEQAGVELERIRVVLNHTSPASRMPQSAVEKTLGRAVDIVLPYQANQDRAIVQGQPLVLLDPGSPFAEQISKLIVAL